MTKTRPPRPREAIVALPTTSKPYPATTTHTRSADCGHTVWADTYVQQQLTQFPHTLLVCVNCTGDL